MRLLPALVAFLISTPALAQTATPSIATPKANANLRPAWSLDLTIHDAGLGIGNSRHIDGLRLNITDARPFVVHGVNLTAWTPREHGGGRVVGLALGVPLTGASEIDGVGLGVGVAAEDHLAGLGVGVLGVGAGGDLDGITIGGLGAAAGGNVSGLTIAGLGGGAGGDLNGVSVAGLGFGAGGDVTGMTVAGLGAGAGGSVRGITVAGLGLGAGGDLEGLGVTLGGLGAGGRVRGVMIAGLGEGAGGSLTGIAVAGLAVGSPELNGFAAAAAVGGKVVRGLFLAPAWFEVARDGDFEGIAVSAFTHVRGEQHGLSIGIVNYASRLDGLQIGLFNWAGNSSLLKLMPLVNVHVD